jgi:flagellar biosynthesis/type III secretory pathway chaperone
MQALTHPAAIDRQLSDIVSRLLRAVEEENQMLAERQGHSLDVLIQKKSQLLLELMRVQKTVNPDALHPASRKLLSTLRTSLEANRRLLAINLAAAKEITDTILEALRQSESDGTYGGAFGGYEASP